MDEGPQTLVRMMRGDTCCVGGEQYLVSVSETVF